MSRLFVPPVLVVYFFMADVLLAVAYLTTAVWGHWDSIFDLNSETSLPTWYASMQYVVSAVVFAAYAWVNMNRADRQSWLLLLLPLFCTLMSMDEAVGFHERLGHALDKLLLGGVRKDSIMPRTGIWPIIGIPCLAGVYIAMRSLRKHFVKAPLAYLRCITGIGLVIMAAAGLDALGNLVVSPGTYAYMFQILAEETLEMTGSTLLLWGAVDLLISSPVRIELRRTLADVHYAANDESYPVAGTRISGRD
jgi:hypothetical protein